MFETKHFFKIQSSVSEKINVLVLNAPAGMHASQCKVKLPDPIFHFCVQHFPIVSKTRKSIDQHKTGHMVLVKVRLGLVALLPVLFAEL